MLAASVPAGCDAAQLHHDLLMSGTPTEPVHADCRKVHIMTMCMWVKLDGMAVPELWALSPLQLERATAET
eukprot:2886800-Alexandrium_andersonii.AAC.1